jgi:hypothetical protein
MRVLVLDELKEDEIKSVTSYLAENTTVGPIDGLFWLYLPHEILSPTQQALSPKAGPYKISIEVGGSYARFELLVRGDMISNEGGGLTTLEQANFVYNFADQLARDLNLITCV